jgi:hypothetical protein
LCFGLEDPLVWLVDRKNLLDLSSFLMKENTDLEEGKKILDRLKQHENSPDMNFFIKILETTIKKLKKSKRYKYIFSFILSILIVLIYMHTYPKNDYEKMISKCKEYISNDQILSCYEDYKFYLSYLNKVDPDFDFNQLFKTKINHELNKSYKNMECANIDPKVIKIKSDSYLTALITDIKAMESLVDLCKEKQSYTEFYQKRDLPLAQNYLNQYGKTGKYYEPVHCWLSLEEKKCDQNNHPPKVSLNFFFNEILLRGNQSLKMSSKVEFYQNGKNLRSFEKGFDLKQNESISLPFREKIEINLNENQQLKVFFSYKNWFFSSTKLRSLTYDFTCESLIEYIGKGKFLKNDLINETEQKLDLQVQYIYQVDLKTPCDLSEWLVESPLKSIESK